MLHHKLLLSCIIAVLHGNRSFICPENNEFVQDYVVAAEYYTKNTDVNPEILAAVADAESKFKKYARGTHGEIGYHQIKRHGAIQGDDLKRSFRDLADLNVNTRIAVEYMNKMAQKCHKKPSLWLSAYNGNKCVSSNYSRTILFNLKLARKQSKELLHSLSQLSLERAGSSCNLEECNHTSYMTQDLRHTTEMDTHVDNMTDLTSIPSPNNWVKIPDPILVTP